ncbi:MAG TPA: SurA N-terminal domain-containing protein [Kofleriaceae bacterium]
MKHYLVLCLVTLPALALARPQDGSTAKLDHVVATVDGRPIFHSEIDEIFERNKIDKPSFDQTQAAIEALIDSALIENAAARLHVEVSESELAQAEAMIKAENHLDDAGLDKALADQHFTRETYRRELARQIRMQRTFALDAPSIRGQVTDAELHARYDEAKKANPSIGSFDSLKDQIREAVYSEKAAVAQGEWVKQMRATAHVERSK